MASPSPPAPQPDGPWAWINEYAPALGLVLTLITIGLGIRYFYMNGFRPRARVQITGARERIKARVWNSGRTAGSVSEFRIVAGDEVVQNVRIAPFDGPYLPQELAPNGDMLVIVQRKDELPFQRDVRVSIRFGQSRSARRYKPQTKDGGFEVQQAHAPGVALQEQAEQQV